MDDGNTKIQQPFGGHNDKDMLSRLPEEILLHILSFLNTEQSIKTSILSKRWRYLWLSKPNFAFFDFSQLWLEYETKLGRYDQAQELRASFLDSIERALVNRNAQCLRNVFLSLQVHVSASRFSSWLSAMAERNVHGLELDLLEQEELVLPDSLCSSKSLTKFQLSLPSKPVLKVPSFICFASLKHLDLYGVVFPDDQSTQQLFSGCPVLEALSLTNCHWENVREITIEIPTLIAFTFFESHSLQDHFLGSKIIISAMNLKYLEVSCDLSIELLPSKLPCLDFASIDIPASNGGLELGLRIVHLFSGLRNVKSLQLSRETLEPLHHNKNLLVLLPTFNNLTSLGCLYEYYVNEYYASATLVYMLEKSPNLETLHLPRGFKPGEEYMMLEAVPACFLSCLKCFRIGDFNGDEGDVALLKHVYKNAPFLKRLAIECLPSLTLDLQKQEVIHQQLRQLREGSVSCSIEFIPYGLNLNANM